MHPAAVPHRRQDALVRQLPRRRQGGDPARRQAPVGVGGGVGGAGDHRLAAGSLGAGHSRRHRERRGRPERLPPRPVAPDAHRGAARAAQPDQELAEVFPGPPVRHQLRPQRVHRTWLCTPGNRKHPQGGRHRGTRPRLGNDDRGRRRQTCAAAARSGS